MSLLQRIFKFLLPHSIFEAGMEESKHWFLVCPHCGQKKSLWEIGGFRYKASSKEKFSPAKCSSCQEWHWFRWQKI